MSWASAQTAGMTLSVAKATTPTSDRYCQWTVEMRAQQIRSGGKTATEQEWDSAPQALTKTPRQ